MYSVTVKDHMMIAHSLPDEFFGPAQQLHGATYVVDAEFMSESLNAQNVVVDIGAASDALSAVVKKLGYKNLDEVEEFSGQLTTTEFLARYIHDELRKTTDDSIAISVTLHESHIASASYRGT